MKRIIILLLFFAIMMNGCGQQSLKKTTVSPDVAIQVEKDISSNETVLDNVTPVMPQIIETENLSISFITDTAIPTFIAQPSTEQLHTTTSAIFCNNNESGWTITSQEDKEVEQFTLAVDHFCYLWNRGIYITAGLLEFMEPVNIKNYLSTNGVKEPVVQVHAFASESYPVTIWVQTEKNHYFITLNDAYEEDFFAEDFVYRFYTQQECIQKYKTRSGKMLINDHAYEMEFTGINAKLSLVTILEELADSVIWESENLAEIVYNDTKYTLNLEKATLLNKQKEDLLGLLEGGSPYICQKGKDLIIDATTARTVCDCFGAILSTDFEKNIVTIT